MIRNAALVFFGLYLQGCAAIFTGTSEQISLRSSVPDTQFLVNGRVVGKGTSAIATVKRKDLKQSVLVAPKEGCSDNTASIETSFNGITLLGLLLDMGLISILVVDGAATGAWTMAAETNYFLEPSCP